VILLMLGFLGWLFQSGLRESWYRMAVIGPHPLRDAQLLARSGSKFRECRQGCPAMVVVPAGKFLMGSPPDEVGRFRNEGPQHEVTFGAPFAVSVYEISYEDWDVCERYGGCAHIDDSHFGRGKQPVVNVSWTEAQHYAAWLSRTTGKPYRLLSETEYEYAARAGSTSAFPWGDAVGKGHGDCAGCGSRWDNQRPAPVGSFAPNGFGLFDMQANIWQWVSDCYHRDYNGAPSNGRTWSSPGCDMRVIRGGSWDLAPKYARSSDRRRAADDSRLNTLGFRVARSLSK